MAFQQKDLKILWGKAAGRCSMPDCRKQLVADASEAVPSKAILLGENCHIVGESENGPRGNSNLSEKDRNRYPNLILLCANHHTVIDQDPGGWSIEKLHQIKADHEVWVETQLTIAESNSQESEYYTNLVNVLTEHLMLGHWGWVCDNAFRCILVEPFVDGINHVCEIVNRAVWPGDYDHLKRAILNLSERLYAYLQHFMSLAMYVEGEPGHFREDKRWKKVWRDDYDEHAERSKAWETKAVNMLSNVVVALNQYAEAVRSSLNSSYFLYEGQFTLMDTMGMSTDGFTPAYYIPKEYIEHES